MFITIKKENINTYYEVIAKVTGGFIFRSWARERLELSTRAG